MASRKRFAYSCGGITVGSFLLVSYLYLFSMRSMRWQGRMKSMMPTLSWRPCSMTSREQSMTSFLQRKCTSSSRASNNLRQLFSSMKQGWQFLSILKLVSSPVVLVCSGVLGRRRRLTSEPLRSYLRSGSPSKPRKRFCMTTQRQESPLMAISQMPQTLVRKLLRLVVCTCRRQSGANLRNSSNSSGLMLLITSSSSCDLANYELLFPPIVYQNSLFARLLMQASKEMPSVSRRLWNSRWQQAVTSQLSLESASSSRVSPRTLSIRCLRSQLVGMSLVRMRLNLKASPPRFSNCSRKSAELRAQTSTESAFLQLTKLKQRCCPFLSWQRRRRISSLQARRRGQLQTRLKVITDCETFRPIDFSEYLSDSYRLSSSPDFSRSIAGSISSRLSREVTFLNSKSSKSSLLVRSSLNLPLAPLGSKSRSESLSSLVQTETISFSSILRLRLWRLPSTTRRMSMAVLRTESTLAASRTKQVQSEAWVYSLPFSRAHSSSTCSRSRSRMSLMLSSFSSSMMSRESACSWKRKGSSRQIQLSTMLAIISCSWNFCSTCEFTSSVMYFRRLSRLIARYSSALRSISRISNCSTENTSMPKRMSDVSSTRSTEACGQGPSLRAVWEEMVFWVFLSAGSGGSAEWATRQRKQQKLFLRQFLPTFTCLERRAAHVLHSKQLKMFQFSLYFLRYLCIFSMFRSSSSSISSRSPSAFTFRTDTSTPHRPKQYRSRCQSPHSLHRRTSPVAMISRKWPTVLSCSEYGVIVSCVPDPQLSRKCLLPRVLQYSRSFFSSFSSLISLRRTRQVSTSSHRIRSRISTQRGLIRSSRGACLLSRSSSHISKSRQIRYFSRLACRNSRRRTCRARLRAVWASWVRSLTSREQTPMLRSKQMKGSGLWSKVRMCIRSSAPTNCAGRQRSMAQMFLMVFLTPATCTMRCMSFFLSPLITAMPFSAKKLSSCRLVVCSTRTMSGLNFMILSSNCQQMACSLLIRSSKRTFTPDSSSEFSITITCGRSSRLSICFTGRLFSSTTPRTSSRCSPGAPARVRMERWRAMSMQLLRELRSKGRMFMRHSTTARSSISSSFPAWNSPATHPISTRRVSIRRPKTLISCSSYSANRSSTSRSSDPKMTLTEKYSSSSSEEEAESLSSSERAKSSSSCTMQVRRLRSFFNFSISSLQNSQWRTYFSLRPRQVPLMKSSEQCPQNSFPQKRQWCRRRKKLNYFPQHWQRGESLSRTQFSRGHSRDFNSFQNFYLIWELQPVQRHRKAKIIVQCSTQQSQE